MPDPYAPPSARVEDLKPGRYPLASRGRRLANRLIDAVCHTLLAVVLAQIVATCTQRDLDSLFDGLNVYPFTLSAVVLYYISCESLFGRTVGKFVTGTRTVTENGQHPSFQRIALRTLMRLIPFYELSLLAARPIGWHDRLSRTRVVRI